MLQSFRGKGAVQVESLTGFLKTLVTEGKLSIDDLAPLLKSGKMTLQELEEPLLERVAREDLLEALAREHEVEGVLLDREDVSPEVAFIIPADLAKSARVACIAVNEDGMRLAMVNPRDDAVVAQIEAKTDFRVRERLIALPSDMEGFLSLLYGTARNLEVTPRDILDRIIKTAVEQGASDIHIEPREDSLCIRLRRDGVLMDGFDIREAAPKKVLIRHLKSALSVVVKNKSGASGKTMNIAETQKPQDGRIYLPGRNLDMRVSVLPTMHGESIAIRIHSAEHEEADLGRLGFLDGDYRRLLSIVESPYGLVLVSGPTGSGKTTTLYSVLRHVNHPTVKILTIEDPIEYAISGITQAQVNLARDFTFADALRSFLRHDPDIIMVGEIRDRETAGMAVESSLTGHLVLSTIHANDAVRTITRLRDLGVNPLLITSTCLATLAQRLIRTNCDRCREPARFSRRFYEAIDRYRIPFREHLLMRGVGCAECNFTGYRGRTGVYELLTISAEIREAILNEVPDEELLALARSQGMRLLIEDALTKAALGQTTESEVWRVTLSEN